MSDLNLPQQPGEPSPSGRQRPAASVTLRQGGRAGLADAPAADAAPSLDPATKSLADALKITFRLLQFAMIIMVVLYILSGFQSVNESERAIRLQFGAVKSGELPSGFQFSLPAPFGELVKIPIGTQPLELRSEFFPRLSEAEEKILVDKDKAGASALSQGGSSTLDPDADGMLITSDGNIAHSRWNITYNHSDARVYATSINPDAEASMVRAAASRGVVQAAANVTIDELLRKQSDAAATDAAGSSKVETLAKDAAQAALDQMGSGIRINQMVMTIVIPPRTVMEKFNQVQSSAAARAQEEEKAQQFRNERMTEAAGEAAEPLIRLIDRYESELALKQGDKAASTLSTIHKIMLREPADIDGKPQTLNIFGKVSEILNQARQYRTSVVNQARSEAGLFSAKRELYASNPMVMIHSEWTDAMRTFLSRDGVQMQWLPPGMASYVLKINKDPAITRQQVIDLQTKAAEAADAERIRKLRQEQLNRKVDSTVREASGS